MQPTFLLIRMCGMSSHEICCNVQMLSIYSYEHIHILSVCEDSQFQHATNILAWGITESCRWAMSHMQMRYVCCSVLRCVAVCCNTQSHFSMQPTFWREVSQSQVAHFNELCRTYKWDMCVAVCCSVLQCVAVCRSVLQYTESCRTYQWTMSHIRMRYVCCSVLQCVAVCRSVSQCVTVCCSVLQGVAVCCSMLQCVAVRCSVLQCVAVCVLQCVAVCCNTQSHVARINELCRTYEWDMCVAVCCSVLQCVAVCCSVLQGVALLHTHPVQYHIHMTEINTYM